MNRSQKLVTLSESVPFKVMILAAGRGERMRPLTDTIPKPLLQADGKALIEYHLVNLACAGFTDIVINHAYLGEIIESTLGDGERYGVNINYSHEPLVLETAGGIANALPLLTNQSKQQPFLVINGDVYCELDFTLLLPVLQRMQADPAASLAHLILVDNPTHHPEGDFALDKNQIKLTGSKRLTFSGIGIYQPKLFSDVKQNTPTKLAPLLRQAINDGKVSGEYFSEIWIDVGTSERLNYLNRLLSQKSSVIHNNK
jgi:N-acetyl-alpha-D-muramate 1-phosphate uridylyltransferase